jgi:hypothetical protein
VPLSSHLLFHFISSASSVKTFFRINVNISDCWLVLIYSECASQEWTEMVKSQQEWLLLLLLCCQCLLWSQWHPFHDRSQCLPSDGARYIQLHSRTPCSGDFSRNEILFAEHIGI